MSNKSTSSMSSTSSTASSPSPSSSSTSSSSPKSSSGGLSSSPKYSRRAPTIWGVNVANIPTTTTESEIVSDFRKYGDILSVKPTGNASLNIVFKSSRSSLTNIINEQKEFKVTPLDSKQLPARQKPEISPIKKSGVTKISLLSSPPVSKSGKYNNRMNMAEKLLAKNSKLSCSAPPFNAPSRIHTMSNMPPSNKTDEGVFFEAVCKSITHGTTEEEVLDFIQNNVFQNIKKEVVKDGMMMLPGESMAVFELNNRDAINKLTEIIDKKMTANLDFNGNKLTLQRKTNNDDVPPPNVKGLSIKLDEEEEQTESKDEKVDTLNIMGWEYGLNDGNKKESDPEKMFEYKLNEEAAKFIDEQAQSLNVAKSQFVLLLGIMSKTGPVPIDAYRRWISSQSAAPEIVPNMEALTDSSDKNSDVLSSAKSGNLDLITLQNTKSFSSIQGSPIGSIGSTPATAALFGEDSNKKPMAAKSSKKIVATSMTPRDLPNLNKVPLIKTGSLPTNLTDTANQSTQRAFQYPNNSALGTSSLFGGNSSSNLISNPLTNSNGISLISPRGNGGISLIQMRTKVGSILSPTNAAQTAALLSPRRPNANGTNASNVMLTGHNANDFGMKPNGFSITTPIPNLAPVSIPGYMQNGANGATATSPINSNGFSSPLGNINTPQSPLANYTGILPAFTPTAAQQINNAMTPTTNLPFYWKNPMNNAQNGALNNVNDGLKDSVAPLSNIANLNSNGLHHNTNQANNQPNQPTNPLSSHLLNSAANNAASHNPTNSLLPASSPLSKPPSAFFKFPVPEDQPKASPSQANNILNGNNMMQSNLMTLNGLGSGLGPIQLQQQHSANSFVDNQRMMNMMNMNTMNMNQLNVANGHHHADDHQYGVSNGLNMNGDVDCDDDQDDEDTRQMDEPPSLDELNNMRSIPSVISPNGTTPVVMITNLNEDQIDCDKIFTLCGVFGDVQRVKISYHKRDTAFVQLANHRQAKHVVTSLNRMQLYGKMIHVNLSRMTRVKLPKDSPNSAMMFPDAKFLTKDYTNCKKHRYSKKGAGGIKYSPLSIGQPSHILHIANLPIQCEGKDLQEFLCGAGIFAKSSPKSRVYGDDAIQSIELIGVNNKLGSCQAFAKCCSVDLACQILIDFHSTEFLGREIKISFATRSHMPSDINKTHKTYSYSAGPKKIGASINSIPTSIPRQPTNPLAPNTNDMDNGNPSNQQQGVAQNSGDTMSSSSSAGSSSSGPSMTSLKDADGGNDQTGNAGNSYRGGYHHHNHNHMDYQSRGNTGYANKYKQRNSYYDNVGYQTYVVNNKPPPPEVDEDKIFVRQHHHSGGRRCHYKLRINK